jgi:hypothetical protein
LFSEDEIDGASLLLLVEKDIEDLFQKKGPRAKFRAALDKLKVYLLESFPCCLF